MDFDNIDKLAENIELLGQHLKNKQDELDKKTKDIEAYKEFNEKLTKLIKLVVFGFLAVLISIVLLLGYTISEYKNLEGSTTTTTKTKRQEFNTDNGGVIINGDGNTSDVKTNGN